MEIAELTFDTKAKCLIKLDLLRKDLRFKCQRCAIFCCKLGGPALNVKDLQRLRQAGTKQKKLRKNHERQRRYLPERNGKWVMCLSKIRQWV
jgi:hypothetical protein